MLNTSSDRGGLVLDFDGQVEFARGQVVADAERGAEVGGIVEGIAGFDAGDGVTLQVGRPVGQVAVDGDRLDGAGEADGAVVGGRGRTVPPAG